MSRDRELIEARDIDELRALTSVKWTRDDPDVLPAWVADMDLRPSAAVMGAVREIVERGDFGYNRRASLLLPETFAAWQERRHGWSLDPEQVRTFCDVLHAIDVALWLHTEPGDGVVLLTPIYHPFIIALDTAERRMVSAPLIADGWRVDAEALAACIDDGTRAILLCNPHNPTGRVFTEEELRAIGEVAVERDLLIISDEVWGDLVYPGHVHRPLASLSPEIAAQTITISSASKAFNLAGLRCAVAHVGHPGLARQLEDLPGHLLGAISTTGAEAALAAWTEGEGWLDALKEHLDARRKQLAARLEAEVPQVGFQAPEATYLAWLDVSAFDLGEEPADRLLEVGRVALSPGRPFGPGGAGHVRMNFATSEAILDQVIDRVVATLTA